MNKQSTTVALAALLTVFGFASAWSPFSPGGYVMAQHEDHNERDHDSPGHDDHDDDADRHSGRERRVEHEEGVVHLNEAQLAGLKLTHVEVKRGSLTTIVELPGEVAWNADRLVHVTPRVRGIVASVEKTLGAHVKANDLLCVLDSREMGDAKMKYLADLSRFEVAHADYARAQIVFENTKKLLVILDPEPAPEQVLARAHNLPVGDNKNKLLTSYTRMKVSFRNYKRNEQLMANKIASEAEFLEAQGAYEIARVDYLSTREEISFDLDLSFLRAEKEFKLAKTEMRNAERALHILGLTKEQTEGIAMQGDEIDADIARAALYSPISGVIVDRHLTRGELVNTNTRLYTIADLSNVWVMGRAYERDIRFLKRGQQTTVRLDAFPGQLFEGEIDYLASQLDPNTRTVQIRVVLPNLEGRLRPGMFGTVVIHIGEGGDGAARDGMLVPAAALQRVKDGFVVFQVVGPGAYKLVPVRVLRKSREFAEVTGAISIGDRLAVGDTFVLKSEAGKEAMGGGHAH